MEQKVIESLARSTDCRAVELRQGGQVELSWDRIRMCLRTTDLIVLNNALRAWMDDPDRDWAQTYSLVLNDCTMFIESDDLYRFCAMIDEATDQLPRRTVRWADLRVRIVLVTALRRNVIPWFSPN